MKNNVLTHVLRVERQLVKENDELFSYCKDACEKSTALYNKAIQTVKAHHENSNKWIRYIELVKLLDNSPEFRQLPSWTAQRVLKQVDDNWKRFFASIKDWRSNPNKYHNRPKAPNEKECGNVYMFQNKIMKGSIKLTLSKLRIKTNVTNPNVRTTVRIIPRACHYVIEILYERQTKQHDLDPKKVMGIDLGLDNLATCTFNDPSIRPIIINGKPLKSINSHFNNLLKKQKKKMGGGKNVSRKIHGITLKRNCKIQDYMHKSSKTIIDYCVQNGVGTIVVGINDNWKKKRDQDQSTSHRFINIPYSKLVQMIAYKGEEQGIAVKTSEESFTSKASFFDMDCIPVFGKITPDQKLVFSGKRVRRGLYETKEGHTVNADVNASLNIIRKSFPKAFEELNKNEKILEKFRKRNANPKKLKIN